MNNKSRAPQIALLNGASRPTAVVFGVTLFVIYTVKGMVRRWLLAHVRIESFKRLFPFVAHKNAAPSIVGKRLMRGNARSLFHSAPTPVFGASRQPMLGRHIAIVAPATFSESFLYCASNNSGEVSAFAVALPRCLTPFVRSSERLDGKPPEFESDKILDARAGRGDVFVSHNGTWISVLVKAITGVVTRRWPDSFVDLGGRIVNPQLL